MTDQTAKALKEARDMNIRLIRWLGQAKRSGHYDMTGLHSFADAARAVNVMIETAMVSEGQQP